MLAAMGGAAYWSFGGLIVILLIYSLYTRFRHKK